MSSFGIIILILENEVMHDTIKLLKKPVCVLNCNYSLQQREFLILYLLLINKYIGNA